MSLDGATAAAAFLPPRREAEEERALLKKEAAAAARRGVALAATAARGAGGVEKDGTSPATGPPSSCDEVRALFFPWIFSASFFVDVR